MRKSIFICAVAGCTLFGAQLMAQSISKKKIPSVVTDALTKKYPTASKITWEKEHGNLEANWGGKSGEDMSVQFTPAGGFVEQTQAIAVSTLPAAIPEYAKAHYKGVKITEAGKVTNAKNETMYEVEIKGKDVLFDKDGNFMKVDAE
jgi:hypothetical protein